MLLPRILVTSHLNFHVLIHLPAWPVSTTLLQWKHFGFKVIFKQSQVEFTLHVQQC